jgi:hypothetical protein
MGIHSYGRSGAQTGFSTCVNYFQNVHQFNKIGSFLWPVTKNYVLVICKVVHGLSKNKMAQFKPRYFDPDTILRVVEMTRVCWALWTNDYTQACFD